MALTLFMVMAIDADVRERRIPNLLVFLVLSTGLVLNCIGPENGRAGPLAQYPGALGLGAALLGVLVGLAVFLPLHLMRAMGAGDVKLLAALGAFLGAVEIINVALFILIAGGVLAVARMLWTGSSRRVLGNVRLALSDLGSGQQRFDPATQSVDRMPYALAFAGGLAAYSYWRFVGGVPLISLG
jgi:prepilin peptidase CpaA